MPVIIIVGTGKCGTRSLVRLVDEQEDSLCFHEMNPSCMAWEGAIGTVLDTIFAMDALIRKGSRQLVVDISRRSIDKMSKIKKGTKIKTLGDAGPYYLPYVERILKTYVDVRIACMKRPKDQTVNSYINKMRVVRTTRELIAERVASTISGKPFYKFRNHWINHSGEKYMPDKIWDKCFPKFQVIDLNQALNEYWDFYYETATKLEKNYSQVFKIFDINDLNNENGQIKMLKFLGVQNPKPEKKIMR